MKNLFSTVAFVVLVGVVCVPSVKAAEQMSPGAKTIAALAVGGLSGYIFGNAYKQSQKSGSLVGAVGVMVALVYLKEGREDAVKQAIGREYVGISALAAVGATIATVNAQ